MHRFSSVSGRPALVAAGLLLALLGSCDSQRPTVETTPELNQATPAGAVSFRKELTADDLHLLVVTTGEPNRPTLAVQVTKNGRELMAATQQLNGPVTDALVTNLNDDAYPELLVLVREAGTGAYGQLVGFEFLNQGRRPVTLPTLAGAEAVGYQGQDSFRVEGRELLRQFPIYRPDDANCCPSGGRRTVRYQLPTQGLTLQPTSFADAAAN